MLARSLFNEYNKGPNVPNTITWSVLRKRNRQYTVPFFLFQEISLTEQILKFVLFIWFLSVVCWPLKATRRVTNPVLNLSLFSYLLSCVLPGMLRKKLLFVNGRSRFLISRNYSALINTYFLVLSATYQQHELPAHDGTTATDHDSGTIFRLTSCTSCTSSSSAALG